MKTPINPKGIAAPASTYHHAFHLQGVSELLSISGQLGERPDGTCGSGAEAQADQAWRNVEAILTDAGMGLGDIVKVVSYVVGKENVQACVSVHERYLGELAPPWTLVVVAALGRPHYLVEVDVLAARS